jgi:ribosomal-protein-alanine N-acetyltransferase
MQMGSLTGEFAAEICTWRYPAPYDCYDMTSADPDELVRPELIGFRSFGPDGRVAGWEYDDTALDTGGGLRPDLVGRGLGRQAISTGLAFGRSQFAPVAFRVTVAAFNTRALRTVEALGFTRISRFEATTDGRPFEVLIRPER